MLAAVLTATGFASACSPAAPTAPPHVNTADIFRFKIGALEAVALKDGDIHVANDGKTLGVGQPRQARHPSGASPSSPHRGRDPRGRWGRRLVRRAERL